MDEFPSRVAVELTNYCNLGCEVCPRHHTRMVYGMMSWELWTKIIDEIAQHDTTLIPTWRGEMMCHSYAAEFLYYAARRVYNLLIVSNGILVGDFTFPLDLLEYVDKFNISIHSKYSLDGLKYIHDHLGPTNIQVSRIEGTLNQQGIWTRAISLAKTNRTYKQHTINGKWGQVEHRPWRAREYCKRLDTDLCIGWDGQVSRCCYVWPTLKYPNINAVDIKHIWLNDPALNDIRDKYPDIVCEECDQWAGKGSTL